MTREEAKREILFSKREVMADSWIDKAYDMAIQALSEPERKKGKWKYTTHYGERYRVCPFCNAERKDDNSTGWNFCPNCGADMREEQDGRSI